jgi:hypothetical protein
LERSSGNSLSPRLSRPPIRAREPGRRSLPNVWQREPLGDYETNLLFDGEGQRTRKFAIQRGQTRIGGIEGSIAPSHIFGSERRPLSLSRYPWAAV